MLNAKCWSHALFSGATWVFGTVGRVFSGQHMIQWPHGPLLRLCSAARLRPQDLGTMGTGWKRIHRCRARHLREQPRPLEPARNPGEGTELLPPDLPCQPRQQQNPREGAWRNTSLPCHSLAPAHCSLSKLSGEALAWRALSRVQHPPALTSWRPPRWAAGTAPDHTTAKLCQSNDPSS